MELSYKFRFTASKAEEDGAHYSFPYPKDSTSARIVHRTTATHGLVYQLRNSLRVPFWSIWDMEGRDVVVAHFKSECRIDFKIAMESMRSPHLLNIRTIRSTAEHSPFISITLSRLGGGQLL